MKWSIPQHRFGTLNSKSIHGYSSNLTVGTRYPARNAWGVLSECDAPPFVAQPRNTKAYHHDPIMIPPGGSSRQSRSSPAPCPCSRWCFAHKLACGKAEASREGSSQQTRLGGRKKKTSSYNKHALIFWHKRRALKMKPHISFSKKEADIRFWNLPWSFHQGNPPVIQVTRAWRLPIDIFGDLVFPSSWVPAVFLQSLPRSYPKWQENSSQQKYQKMSFQESILNLFAACKLCMTMAFLIWACPKTRATSRMVSLPTRTATNQYMLCIPHVWAMGHTCLAIWCLQSWQVIGAKKLSDTQTTIAAFPSWVGW